MGHLFKSKLQKQTMQGHHSKLKVTPLISMLICLLVVLIMSGCVQSQPAPPSSSQEATEEQAGLVLPTQRPTVEPSPVSTRVMSEESLTPAPTPTITPIPDETLGMVVEVIDGDTIAVVMDGDPMRLAYQVRYIGVDAPPNDVDNPWGVVAYETNHKLANLKVVRLVRDETDFDEDGYLLRYVYAGDMLLNEEIVEQGLAEEDATDPNTRLEAKIQAAEASAKGERLGIWSNKLPTATPPSQSAPAKEEASEAETTPAATVGRQTPTGAITATAQITATLQITTTTTVEATSPSTVTATDTPEPTVESTAPADLKKE